ncbi:MAG: ATP-binding protein [Deltaproteobacteria bacterium]
MHRVVTHDSSSVRRRLTVAIVAVSMGALLFASGGFLAYEWFVARRAVMDELELVSNIMGEHLSAALAFDDALAAEDGMQALSRGNMIEYGCLYNRDGALVGVYPQNKRSECPPSTPGLGWSIDSARAEYGATIHSQDEEVGTLYLLCDFSDRLHGRIQRYGLIAALTVLILTVIVYFLSARLRTILSKPVAKLVETAKKISEQRDYQIRAVYTGEDELGIGALTRSFNEMLDQLQARDAELVRMRDDAEAAARAKAQFLANMSHEIRTPINGFMGMTTLLLDSRLDRDQRDLATTALHSAELLLTVVNDVLDFSKIDAGRMVFESIAFDLRALLEAVRDVVITRAQEADIRLIVSIDPSVPEGVVGDPTRLRQILINLVGNAIKFTQDGHVLLAVERSSGGRTLRFVVEDTGIGIPEDRLEALFSAFTQVDVSNTRRFGGTGLGLAITKKLTEGLGGSIGVESKVGEGSRFIVELPMVEGSLESSQGVRALRSGWAVVLDDNAVARKALLDDLISLGCDAVGFGDLGALRAWLDEGVATPRAVFVAPTAVGGFAALDAQIESDADLEAVRWVPLVRLGESVAKRPWAQTTVVAPPRRRDVADALVAEPTGEVAAGPRVATVPRIDGGRQVSVLVAEDNKVNQKVARRMLEAIDCVCVVVDNGRLAVEAVQAHTYDLVLMDCQMPQMDGYEATAAIRALEDERASIPIVALTAEALPEDRGRCIDAGMDEYLSKPIDRAALLETLTRIAEAADEATRRAAS